MHSQCTVNTHILLYSKAPAHCMQAGVDQQAAGAELLRLQVANLAQRIVRMQVEFIEG